jgi:5-(carboxyamino)imidazole ribonucleotide synthase
MAADAPRVDVKPGDAIGILGGGQLGRMLATAAAELGLDVHIYTPEEDSPASRVAARTTVARYDDRDALVEFAKTVSVVTLEFENVPAGAVEEIIATGVAVRPGPRALETAQDRFAEKTFLKSIGVPPPAFERIDGPGGINSALDRLGGKGILKTRFSGYDGKGQARLEGRVNATEVWERIGGQPAILEALVDFEKEISVIAARGADGEFLAWDPPENDHAGGILRRSAFPASVPQSVLDEAVGLARKLADSLDYVGVLALELFLTRDGRLLANEFAPRVHNSGHWTTDACATSQFEQQIRAVCGWPLGDVTRHSDGEMINLLGSDVDGWERWLSEGAKLHMYGKRQVIEGRKLGHVTRLRGR